MRKDKKYFINQPIFVKYKQKFNWFKLTRVRSVKGVFINERIVELPFVFLNLPEDRKTRILDLGCSESSLPLHLASMGYQVTGVDMRDFPYAHPCFRFVQSDILHLDFETESFDVVTCISTLEHIGLGYYADTKNALLADSQAMSEIRRVLDKEGLLLLSVPFGVKAVTAQQRIYDSGQLQEIFAGFTVLEKRFFANTTGSANNYWQESTEVEAEKIQSSDGNTRCVVLIKARKET